MTMRNVERGMRNRWVLSLGAMLALPPTREWRLMGAATAVVWYFLTGLIARRVVLEWIK